MSVSLNSQSRQAATHDITVGLGSIKGFSDADGIYWELPGKQEKIRCKQEAKDYAERLDRMIQANLERGQHRSDLLH